VAEQGETQCLGNSQKNYCKGLRLPARNQSIHLVTSLLQVWLLINQNLFCSWKLYMAKQNF